MPSGYFWRLLIYHVHFDCYSDRYTNRFTYHEGSLSSFVTHDYIT